MNHVQTNSQLIESLSDAGVKGIVVAGTGNGALSNALQKSLTWAQSKGVEVRISSRCQQGTVVPTEMHKFEVIRDLNPVKARIALILELMAKAKV